jgi:hypothetical protein
MDPRERGLVGLVVHYPPAEMTELYTALNA